MLTGNKDVDMMILSKLNDVDLVNTCQVNKMANEVCNDQKFWLNRILSKFPINLEVLTKYKGDRSWSDYYIDLRRITPETAQKYLFNGTIQKRLDHVIIALHEGDINKDTNSLIFASMLGYLDMVKYLVEQGVDIHADGPYGPDSPLKAATNNRHLDVVEYLTSKM